MLSFTKRQHFPGWQHRQVGKGARPSDPEFSRQAALKEDRDTMGRQEETKEAIRWPTK